MISVNPENVKVGEIITVKPGEKVPLDGFVIEGSSSLNTVALTGESVPRSIHPGDDILSGCINLNGVVRVSVSKPFGESTASKIINLVEKASENKSKSENFITKFAHIYTPIVVVLAIITAFVPPLLTDNYMENFGTWLYRSLTFLVVSCPCALVISVPLTFFGGIGGASRKGILVKGSNYMETLAHTKTIAFDKTGTMTKGVFDVTAIHPDAISPNMLLHLAAHVERFSTHPIAISLRKAYPNEADSCDVDDVKEIAGQGITAKINGKTVSVGNTKLMDSIGAEWHPCHKTGTTVHVAINGVYAGHIVVSDKIKDDAAEAITELKRVGVKRIVMLTGDKEEVAADVAKTVGINEYHAELLPAGKVEKVEMLLKETVNGAMAFAGDGINDAPVLARADVGIAMGALGSDAAIEAADVVLMDDKPSKIAVAISHARRTLRIALENTWFAIIIKVAVLILAFIGLASMPMAVFADVGVTVIAVINATRALK
jgi:Cd2+/Zn2+-exporting ATPase